MAGSEIHEALLPPKGIQRPRVLVVDDDAEFREALLLQLAFHGYDCEGAEDGYSGTLKAKEWLPSLILLDIAMPNMDGLSACRILGSDPLTRHIPVVIVTATNHPMDKTRALDAGAADYITKPIDSFEMLMRVRNLIKLRQFDEERSTHEALKRTFDLVQRAHQEWLDTVDCISDMILMVDDHDNIIRCNKAVVDVIKIPLSEIVGKPWAGLFSSHGVIPLDNRKENSEYITSCGKIYRQNDFSMSSKLEAGRNEHVITFSDITEFRRLANDLISSKKELEQAYESLKEMQSQLVHNEKMSAIGQLAAGVAHEINNPIGFIMSNLSSMAKYIEKITLYFDAEKAAVKDAPEGLKAALAEARKTSKLDYLLEDMPSLIMESLDGAERVKSIVRDLKSFSRADQQEESLADINKGIESTLNIVWNEIKYKASVEKEYGDIPLTRCNPGQLNQVFMNLLINAAHAIAEQGVIKIKTWSDSRLIFVSFEDSGCGIQPELISKIFEPFYTTKEVGKGTGLGLSIASDIIRKHGGTIEVESEPGRGTKFKITIPVREA